MLTRIVATTTLLLFLRFPASSFADEDVDCANMIKNGDFDDGNYIGWTAHDDVGTLILFPDSASGNRGDGSLLHSGRTDPHVGPEHLLDPRCFRTDGDRLSMTAYVKLLKDGEGYQCDRDVTDENDPHVCPIMTLQAVLPDGKYHYRYAVNTVERPWEANKWNEEHYYIDVDDNLSKALEVRMYVERVAVGVDIALDHVRVMETPIEGDLESLGIPNLEEYNETDYESKNLDDVPLWSPNCTHMIVNGDAEEGDTRGWSARLGGKILRYPNGYGDESSTALFHTARSSFIMGPQHQLVAGCLVEGKRYRFEAQLMLIDGDGNPFSCVSDRHWADDDACPLLTVQYTYDGKDDWIYFENEHPGPWVADGYNPYRADIMITREMRESSKAVFYFERVKAGVSIVWDQVALDRDCSAVVPNGDAESQTTLGWYPTDGNGVIKVVNHTDYDKDVVRGHNDLVSHAYFEHSGRKFRMQGPRNNFDVHCLVADRSYEIKLYIKIVDSRTGQALTCDRFARPNSDVYCPVVGIAYTDANDKTTVVNLPNDAEQQGRNWRADFNYYHAVIDVNQQMADSHSAYIFIKGPLPHINILFDDFEMKVYHEEERGCDELIYNGSMERGITGWGASVGTINRFADGFENSFAIAHYGREAYSDTIRHKMDVQCLVEGKQYVFKSFIKLFDKDMNPYKCERSAKYGDEEFCVLVTLYVGVPTGIKPIHLPNMSPLDWNATDWNVYRNDFVINVDLAEAKSAYIMVRGPKKGVVVVLDDVEIVEYVPPAKSCKNLLANSDLEDFDMNAWEPYGGSKRLSNGGALGSATAILHFDRPSTTSGMRQFIDTSCLVAKKRYRFSAHFQLFDQNNEPFYCNSEAKWGAQDFCIMISIHYKMANGNERARHFLNDYPVGWVKDKFNFFSVVIAIPPDVAMADEAYILIKGPRNGVAILADMIQMKEYIPPQRNCRQMIMNPSASAGDLMGWHSNNGGYFSFYEYDQGKIAYKFYDRKHLSSGPKHFLDVTCFKQGAKYEVDGLFQLLDANGQPFACDKKAPWADPRYCILATIEIIPRAGNGPKRIHIGNAFTRPWFKDRFNAFRGAFIVTKDLARAKSAFIYFQGPRANSSLVFDSVTLTAINIAS